MCKRSIAEEVIYRGGRQDARTGLKECRTSPGRTILVSLVSCHVSPFLFSVSCRVSDA